MTAHIQFPQIEKETYNSIKSGEEINIPATLSKTMITDILRGDMGYNGVVVTDSLDMAAIKEHFTLEDTAKLAINADVDMLLIPFYPMNADDIAKFDEYINSITDMVKNKEIDEDTITKSAERIVALKIKRGLLEYNEDVEQKIKEAKKIVGSKEHHDKELEIGAKAVTLLKNENNVFPAVLGENEKAVVFCASEDYFEGVEYGKQILKENNIIPENADIEVYSFGDASFKNYIDKVKGAKYIIIDDVMLSLKNIDPSGDTVKFINEALSYAKENNIHSAVMSMYMPYDVARYQNADALFAVYSSKYMPEMPTEFNGETKTYGPGYTAALCAAFGYIAPQGKLPVDIYELEDNSYSDKILYNIGYGLEYEKTRQESTSEITTEENSQESKTESSSEKNTKKERKGSSYSGSGNSSKKAALPKNTETKGTKPEESKEHNNSVEENKEINLQIGNDTMLVNGTEVKLDSVPIITDNETLVPIRAIVEALDGDVQWDSITKTAVITNKSGNKIVLTANSNTAYCSNKIKQLDTPLVIMNNRIMLSIKFVAENFGYMVDWNESERQIIIKKIDNNADVVVGI